MNQTDPRGLLAQLSAAAQAGLGASGAFATMAPAGQRQNTALETVAASVGLASFAYGPGGDRTTPHNQARDTAKLALGIEMMKQYGPGALSRMRTEVEVPHGAKRHRYPGVPVPPANARSGRIDILFQETAQRVAIWEVKSALTREAREFANGKADVVHYIGRYQQAFPGQQAAAGIPMPIPYPVLLRTDHQVYSPYGNHDGVVMYRKWPAGQPPPTTVPERVPERVPEPRREPRWWEFWKWDWDWPWEWDIDWGKVLGGLLAGLAIAAVIAAIIVSLPALAVAAAVVGLLSLIPLPEYPDPNDPRNLA